MKYKLIDVKKIEEEDVLFGTCELCEYMGTHYYDILVFQDEAEKTYYVENGAWSWGNYLVNWWIDNYVHFADFVRNRNYPLPKKDKYDEHDLKTVIDEMYQDYVYQEYGGELEE